MNIVQNQHRRPLFVGHFAAGLASGEPGPSIARSSRWDLDSDGELTTMIPQKRPLTFEDYGSWPAENRCERIDGDPYASAPSHCWPSFERFGTVEDKAKTVEFLEKVEQVLARPHADLLFQSCDGGRYASPELQPDWPIPWVWPGMRLSLWPVFRARSAKFLRHDPTMANGGGLRYRPARYQEPPPEILPSPVL